MDNASRAELYPVPPALRAIHLHSSALHPAHLDALLRLGWYRMQQRMFTTDAIDLGDGAVYEVHWARVRLRNYEAPASYSRLHRRCARFSLTLNSTARIDGEVEALYAAYHRHIAFDAAPAVRDILLGEEDCNGFPTRMWTVRDGAKLIGAGYFDEGAESNAGILNFYHPDYKGFSLGKWLYFETLLHAQRSGKAYFYPGYIAPGYPRFDYKLDAGCEHIEILCSNGHWVPYAEWIMDQEVV